MFGQLISTVLLIVVLIKYNECTQCKAADKTCKKLDELQDDSNCFVSWAKSKCSSENTVIDKTELDKYKGCVKKHVEPCISHSEELKSLYVGVQDKFDLSHICTKKMQDEVQHYMLETYQKHQKYLDEEGAKQCSILRQAMNEVKTCVGIK